LKSVLSLGSNLGNREEYIQQAIHKISLLPGTSVLTQSALLETEPWGKTDQTRFINCALLIETQLTAFELLENILKIEIELGRVRHEKWGERTIDIDIIFYEDEIINSDILTIPHPFMHEREFVLESLIGICPEYEHPVLKLKVKELLNKIKQGL